MYYLNFKINANVFLADGQDVAKGAVVSFLPYANSLTPDNKLPCDLRWWVSEDSQNKEYSKVIVCLDKERKNLLVNAYLPASVPIEEFSYVVFRGWAKTFLENIYGAGNIETIK